MLTLAFFQGDVASSEATLTLSDIRVTGGAIWNPMQYGLIATYADGFWRHHGQLYSRLTVTGGGCLLFGIAREPTLISDVVQHFEFTGPTLIANDIGIARYLEQQDTWHGLVRPMSWTSMRIVSSEGVSALVDQSHVALLNPWEPSRSYVVLVSAGVSKPDPLQSGSNVPDQRITRH